MHITCMQNNNLNYIQLQLVMITTAVFNGIEFRIKPNGAVEIFADRPSEVQIADLQKLLTSFLETQTSAEAQVSCHYQQLSYKLHEEPCRKAGLDEDLYHH